MHIYSQPFKIGTELTPKGDQEKAISLLVEGLDLGYRYQTLLGATGTGKTFSMASVIQRTQRPALIIAHNKTLAAQLCEEFRNFFPDNAVHYFISYYDYYQPEAYIPGTDTYIEKDAGINEEIERLRFAATQCLLERKDCIIVASVSCIYGLGSPDLYAESAITFKLGETLSMDEALQKLIRMQFTRNDLVLSRGNFRVKGDTLEVQPKESELITRVEFFGDQIERIRLIDPLLQKTLDEPKICTIFPATHYVMPEGQLDHILPTIQAECDERHAELIGEGKLLEAQRLKQRVQYDLEMINEVGYCNGIENYSRYFDGRIPGTPPYTLLDFLPKDALVFIDESHQTIPQIKAMYNGDRQRKMVLIDYGFRLPSALDNRPLKIEEFWERAKQVIYVSATPGPFEISTEQQRAEQIIRPTYIVDPVITIHPTENQIDHLIHEIQKTIGEGLRVLVTTLTKKMAEELSRYLGELNIKVQYIHSDIKTLERSEILKDLRLGLYDVIIGVNLLREGLDLPEVGLVAIMDADKEGFLRSETSLVQTIGRAARNVKGRVLMYADRITGSMERALKETERRRKIQEEYNQLYGTVPKTIEKAIRQSLRPIEEELNNTIYLADPSVPYQPIEINAQDLDKQIEVLEKEMKKAAKLLDFEKAVVIRDQLKELRALKK